MSSFLNAPAPCGHGVMSPVARGRAARPSDRVLTRSHVLDSVAKMMAPVLERASTADALLAVRDGDLAALGRAYDEHHAVVRAFARRMVGEAAAEDLVHDTFLSLPRALKRFSGDSSLRTFIIGVAINHARHHLRAQKRRRRAMQRFAEQPSAPSASPEDASDQQRLAAMLQRALDGLSFEHRTAFVLCEVEQRPSPEVAQILDIPEGTVRTRLYHARKKLRRALQAEATR